MTLQRALTASIAAALASWLAACGAAEPPARAPNLALACQTMDCICTAKAAGAFDKRRAADMLWRSNGDAYCPEGFVLEPAGN